MTIERQTGRTQAVSWRRPAGAPERSAADTPPAYFPIDDGIPIPPGSRFAERYPWARLKVGQSFFVPGRKTMRETASKAAKRHGIKLTTRRVDGGVRVWRIK